MRGGLLGARPGARATGWRCWPRTTGTSCRRTSPCWASGRRRAAQPRQPPPGSSASCARRGRLAIVGPGGKAIAGVDIDGGPDARPAWSPPADLLASTTGARWSRSATTTSPSSSSPAAPPARPRPPSSPTATCGPTSSRCWRSPAARRRRGGAAASCRCSTSSGSTSSSAWRCRRLDGRAHGALRRPRRPRGDREHGVTVISGAPTDVVGAGHAARRRPRRPGRACAWRSRRRRPRPDVVPPGGRPLRRRRQPGLRAHRGVAGGHRRLGHEAPEGSDRACRCPASRSASSTPGRTCSSATPARCGCGGPTCSPATGRTTRPPRRARPRRLAPHRRHGRRGRRRLPVPRRPGQGRRSSCRGSTCSRPRSRRCCAQHPAVAEAAVVGVPHPAPARRSRPTSVPADGRRSRRTRSSPSRPSYLARYKCRPRSMFVDELPQAVDGKLRPPLIGTLTGAPGRLRRQASLHRL